MTDCSTAAVGSPLRGSGLIDRAELSDARSISAFTNKSPLRAPARGCIEAQGH